MTETSTQEKALGVKSFHYIIDFQLHFLRD